MIRVSLLHMTMHTSAIFRSWDIQEVSEHQFRPFLAVSERWGGVEVAPFVRVKARRLVPFESAASCEYS